MQIKCVTIDNILYINFIIFNISSFFILIYPAENGVRLIYPCDLYAVKFDYFD